MSAVASMIERHLVPDEDADFAAAALRRRFLALFTGPVRHRQVSLPIAAKLIGCTPDELKPQVELLRRRGKILQRTTCVHGAAERGLYFSLPSPKAPKQKPSATEPEPERMRRTREQVLERRQVYFSRYLQPLLDLARQHERLSAADCAKALGCASSTAWSALSTLEHEGLLSSAYEPVSASGRTYRRYYRLRDGAQAQQGQQQPQQEGT